MHILDGHIKKFHNELPTKDRLPRKNIRGLNPRPTDVISQQDMRIIPLGCLLSGRRIHTPALDQTIVS